MMISAGINGLVWPSDWPTLKASQLCQILPIDGVSKYEGGYQFQHMCSEAGNDFDVYPGMEVVFYATQDFELLFECSPGDTVLETCYDGSTITVKTCQDYRLTPTQEVCPVQPTEPPPSEPPPEEPPPPQATQTTTGTDILPVALIGGVIALIILTGAR